MSALQWFGVFLGNLKVRLEKKNRQLQRRVHLFCNRIFSTSQTPWQLPSAWFVVLCSHVDLRGLCRHACCQRKRSVFTDATLPCHCFQQQLNSSPFLQRTVSEGLTVRRTNKQLYKTVCLLKFDFPPQQFGMHLLEILSKLQSFCFWDIFLYLQQNHLFLLLIL